jgi:hypothetical protein
VVVVVVLELEFEEEEEEDDDDVVDDDKKTMGYRREMGTTSRNAMAGPISRGYLGGIIR